jgi:hypothetical protein
MYKGQRACRQSRQSAACHGCVYCLFRQGPHLCVLQLLVLCLQQGLQLRQPGVLHLSAPALLCDRRSGCSQGLCEQGCGAGVGAEVEGEGQ